MIATILTYVLASIGIVTGLFFLLGPFLFTKNMIQNAGYTRQQLLPACLLGGFILLLTWGVVLLGGI